MAQLKHCYKTKDGTHVLSYVDIPKGHPRYKDAVKFSKELREEKLKMKKNLQSLCKARQAREFIKLGKYKEALKAYNESLAYDVDDYMYDRIVEVWCHKGFVLYKLGLYKESIEALNKAIQLGPLYAESYNNKGISLYSLGRYAEAIKAYKKAIEIFPDFTNAWNNMGVVLHRLGNHKKAMEAYNTATKLSPECIEAWHNKQIAYNNLGCYEELLNIFNKPQNDSSTSGQVIYSRISMVSTKEKILKYLAKAIRLNDGCKEEAHEARNRVFKKVKNDSEFKRIVYKDPMKEKVKRIYLKDIYKSLCLLSKIKPEKSISAIFSLKLLLADIVGRTKYKELIAQWNEELRNTAYDAVKK